MGEGDVCHDSGMSHIEAVWCFGEWYVGNNIHWSAMFFNPKDIQLKIRGCVMQFSEYIIKVVPLNYFQEQKTLTIDLSNTMEPAKEKTAEMSSDVMLG